MRSPGLRSCRHSLKAGMESVKPLAKEVAGKCWGFLSARSLLVPSPAGYSPYSFQWPACPHFLSLYPTPPASQCHSFTSLPSSEMRQAWLVWPPLGRPSSCHLFEAPFDGLPSPLQLTTVLLATSTERCDCDFPLETVSSMRVCLFLQCVAW